ncbi:MAG: LTA synthase family protein, partial [Eubacteriales bacterium]|nr:LTA synthase family protein [Eubacteriales bacterium]
ASLLDSVNFSQLTFLSNGIFLIAVVINLSIVAFIFASQKTKYLSVRTCNIATVLCCLAVGSIFFTLPEADIQDSASICAEDGYIRGFIVNAQLWGEMNDAIGSTVSAADAEFEYGFTTREATTDIKPNIIYIMSEAFWDVTLLPNITFSEDPIPTLHALGNEGISGNLVSPMYGGGTDNVEFEVITGFSLKYFPYQTNVYTTALKKPIPSIPRYLKSMGYQTLAVHPYEGTFFDRKEVYPLLGIDRFIALEDMKDTKVKGAYASDDFFADYIISEYKQAQKPVYMYNISMQNHWPYTTENYYSEYEIEVKSKETLTKDQLIALRNYTQGIHDADASLKKITDYFRTIKEPTVVVFMGDHLPVLTEQFGIYKDLGYIDSTFDDINTINERLLIDCQKILKTPYLIWSNYEIGSEKGKTLSASYLGSYVMSKIGMEIPPFYNFLLDYSNKVPVNRYFLAVDASGRPFLETPAAYNNYESTYENIQKNMMFGEQNQWTLFEVKQE